MLSAGEGVQGLSVGFDLVRFVDSLDLDIGLGIARSTGGNAAFGIRGGRGGRCGRRGSGSRAGSRFGGGQSLYRRSEDTKILELLIGFRLF